MPSLQYKAVNPITGEIIKNTITGAITKQELYNKLKDNGLTPIEINTTFGLNLSQKTFSSQANNEAEIKIKKKIRAILGPQIIQLVAIILLLMIGIAIIFPNIQNIVNQTSQLPDIIETISKIWYYIILAIVGVLILGALYTKTEQFQYKWNSLKERVIEDKEFNLDKFLYEISKKLIKAIYIASAVILIFFILTALIPSIQMYLSSIK